MRIFGILFLLLTLVFDLRSMQNVLPDTSGAPSIKYSRQQFKKEQKDLKNFEKQIKEWKSAVKKSNPDYLNSLMGKLMETLRKEHDEMSDRVSERSKKMLPPGVKTKQDSAFLADRPKVYNAELADQRPRITKEEIFRKKLESDYLSEYVPVVREEKKILARLKNIDEFNSETPSSVFTDITNDFEQFREQMKIELALLKRETAKK